MSIPSLSLFTLISRTVKINEVLHKYQMNVQIHTCSWSAKNDENQPKYVYAVGICSPVKKGEESLKTAGVVQTDIEKGVEVSVGDINHAVIKGGSK